MTTTRRIRRAILAIPLLTFLALGRSARGVSAGQWVVGCDKGGGGSAKIVKLAFVTNNTSEFWKIAAAGVHKYEKEGKVQVDIKLPPNGTPEDQNQILQNLSSQGYDAIAVSVIAPNDQTPLLNKIAEKSQLLTFDSDA